MHKKVAEKSLAQIITSKFITAFFYSPKTTPLQAESLLALAHARGCADRFVFRAYSSFFARLSLPLHVERAVEAMASLKLPPDPHVLTSLADAYHSRSEHTKVVSTVQRIVDSKLEMNASAACLMIQSLSHLGDLSNALLWYSHLCYCRLDPLVSVFKSLLRVIADHGTYHDLLGVLRDLHNHGFYADAAMHYHIIRFYVRHGDTENAQAAFENMKRQGFAPKYKTYAIMLRALSSKGESSKSEEIVQEMAVNGVGHSKTTFNSMLAMHARDGNGEKIENVVEEMEKQGIKPEVGGYNMRIAAWAASGNVNKCEELVRELEERGIKMDLYTISTMITCYGKKQAGVGTEIVEKCRKWWNKVKELDLKANLVTYNAMLHVYDNNKMVRECMALFEEMKRERVRANIITYNTLIHANMRDGNQFAVYTLRDQMVRQGMTPDKFTYMCLLKLSAKKSQDTKEVDGLREEMKRGGIQLDVHMYTTLLDMYGKLRDKERCKRVWQEMKEMGVAPTKVTFEVLRKHSMDECIQQQNIFVPSENG